MSEPIASLVATSDRLVSDDSTWRNNMADLADLFRPLRAELRGQTQSGARRTRGIYDSTGIHANQNFGAGLYGQACNPSDVWFTFASFDPELNKWGRVRDYLETVSRRTLASFGPSWSQFYAQSVSLFLDIGCFGSGVFYSEVKRDLSGFNDMCRSLSECSFEVDENGEPNRMFRRWCVPAGLAVKMFSDGGAPSAKLQEKAKNDANAAVELLHAVVPNEDYKPAARLKSKAFDSVYIEIDGKHELHRGGYDDFPFTIPRWEVASGEKWGRGPGELALADMRSLNVMQRDNLKAGQRAADPPWGAPQEGAIRVIRQTPGKISFGAINSRGQQLLKPLIEGGQTPFSLEMKKDLREAVQDGFYFSLMQLAQRTGMTATEVLTRNEEKMRLMGPYMGRIQTDHLNLLVVRRYKQLAKIPGVFPPPPPELQHRSLQVEFVSPMALAQKSARGANIVRAGQAIEAIMPLDPSAADRWNGDKAAQDIGEAFGVPGVILDDEQTAARREQRQKMQMMQQAMAAAKPLADAAHKGAQAAQVVNGGGQQAA